MLELTTDLHDFYQQTTPEEFTEHLTELCYLHNIEITDLHIQPGLSHYGPRHQACQLIGSYQNRLFIFRYDPYQQHYNLYVQRHCIGRMHTFQDLITSLHLTHHRLHVTTNR